MDNRDVTTGESVGAIINRVADQFELAWRSGKQPEIEEYLTNDLTPQVRDELLRELVLMDIACRKQIGATPDFAAYRGRFPELDRWLSRLVAIGLEPAQSNEPALRATDPAIPQGVSTARPGEAALDTADAGKRVSCPHCKNPIEPGQGDAKQGEGVQPDRVLCPACGGSFRILDTMTATTTAQTKRIGKFELMEKLGVGAFGEVWRARDTQLGRDVAIKIPRANLLDSPEDRERFLREARAAAQLRHPGIVPVHDVAEVDGRPIIVSGFVDGLTLHELLEIRRLAFRESAALLADVAESLDYAHRQGLVHRDIKPANILIEYPRGIGAGASLDGTVPADTGPAGVSPATDSTGDRRHHAPRDALRPAERDVYGCDPLARPRPMILDFGLALRPQAEATITRDNQPIGTPAYMSPEQAAGESHDADARSDVYSLGVVLYELLVGELPFRGNLRMITLQVLNDEPRPPRRTNDRIPRDLETVCLKAMSKSPGRRYPTARELADDLHRWLRGEPIHARPVTAAERAWRWANRNRLTASLAAGIVAILGVGLAIATALWLHADRQRQLAESEGLRATRAAAEAAERQQEAESERTRAEDNYRTARRAVDEFFTQVGLSRELKAQGLEPFRRRLLKTAHEYYDQFAHDRPNDPDAQKELGHAYGRLGFISRSLGQHAESQAFYEKSRESFAKLRHDQPDNPSYADSLGAAHLGLAQVFSDLRQSEQAEANYQEALRIRKQLAEAHHDVARYAQNLAVTYGNLAILYRNYGKSAEAEVQYRAALEIYERLANEQSDSREFRFGVAQTQLNLAETFHHTRRMDQAEQAYETAKQCLEQLDRDYPDVPDYAETLAMAHNNFALAVGSTGRMDLAETSLRNAIEIQGKLARRHADVPAYQSKLASIYESLGMLYNDTSRPDEAESMLLEAEKIFESLAQNHPHIPDYQQELADVFTRLGAVSRGKERVAAAEERYRSAARTLERLVKDYADVLSYKGSLAGVYDNLGVLLHESHRNDEAIASYQHALQLREEIARSKPETAGYRSSFAKSMNNLGTLYAETGQSEQADEAFRQSLDIREKLLADHPDILDYAIDVGVSQCNLGNFFKDAGQTDAALNSFAKAVETLKGVLAREPRFTDGRHFLRNTYRERAKFFDRLHRAKESLHDWQQTVELSEALGARSAAGEKWDLAAAYNGVGGAKLNLGDHVGAREAFHGSLEIRREIAGASPESVPAQLNIASCLGNLGEVELKASDYMQAARLYEQAVEIVERFSDHEKVRDNPLFKEWLEDWRGNLDSCRNALKAIDDLDFALSQPAEAAAKLLVIRATVLASRGQAAAAAKTAAKLRDLQPPDATNLYNAGCCFSLACAAVGKDKAELSELDRAQQQEYADQAIQSLRKAIELGFREFDLMRKDSDLNAIRGLPAFRSLVE